jgi:UDP-N-acetylmuramoyl-L-alanyl-D-glutamate--2,6-diaminopimelate ligase
MVWYTAAPGARTIGEPPLIANLTHDSRLAGPGVGFVAVPGGTRDGHDYIEAAVRAGASVVVVQADRQTKWAPYAGRLPLVVVPDTRQAIGLLAAAVHGDPSARLRLIGVTGTDGKTTTAHLTAHLLSACGLASGYLTSVGFEAGTGFELNASHMTTVESTTIQSKLAEAERNGLQSMVVESSSEGLAQHRLNGCHFDVAVFTNLTRDHLDFHGTMERYLEAKGRLFEMLDQPSGKSFAKVAVLNTGDPASVYLKTRSRAPVLTYGEVEGVDFRVRDVQTVDLGLNFLVEARGVTLKASLPLIGRFNALNSLAAVAVTCSQGAELSEAVEALSSFPGIPGRMERIDCGQPFRVIVDIASTPAALENVLLALRLATRGKLWVVFGAAGGRDPARRTGMGAVAGRLADRAVLTSEDPRDEDAEAIIAAIAEGLREGRMGEDDYTSVADRREAIAHAFAQAGPDDTVLLAGKATETTMIVRGQALPWDERALARELLTGG